MKTLLSLCVLLAVCSACSKRETPPVAAESAATAPTSAESPAPAPVATPAPTPSQPAAAPAATAPKPRPQPVAAVKPLEGRVDAHMTSLLRQFVAQKGRMPNSILELAGATSDGFPLAPAGYIYAIDPATSDVKLIKQ